MKLYKCHNCNKNIKENELRMSMYLGGNERKCPYCNNIIKIKFRETGV